MPAAWVATVAPVARVDGAADVVLAGEWVGPTGFLADACFASARRAAELLDDRPQAERCRARYSFM